MDLNDIKQAIAAGNRVYWSNRNYRVIFYPPTTYNIVYNEGVPGEHSIGLTWQDGVTMNGKPEEFFTE